MTALEPITEETNRLQPAVYSIARFEEELLFFCALCNIFRKHGVRIFLAQALVCALFSSCSTGNERHSRILDEIQSIILCSNTTACKQYNIDGMEHLVGVSAEDIDSVDFSDSVRVRVYLKDQESSYIFRFGSREDIYNIVFTEIELVMLE